MCSHSIQLIGRLCEGRSLRTPPAGGLSRRPGRPAPQSRFHVCEELISLHSRFLNLSSQTPAQVQPHVQRFRTISHKVTKDALPDRQNRSTRNVLKYTSLLQKNSARQQNAAELVRRRLHARHVNTPGSERSRPGYSFIFTGYASSRRKVSARLTLRPAAHADSRLPIWSLRVAPAA